MPALARHARPPAFFGPGDQARGPCAARVEAVDPLTVDIHTHAPHPTMPNLIIAQQDRDDVVGYIIGLRDKK